LLAVVEACVVVGMGGRVGEVRAKSGQREGVEHQRRVFPA